MSNNSGLDQLAEASSLTDALLEIQQDLQSLHEGVNRLKGTGSHSTLHLPQSGDERASETIMPQSGVQEPTKRIPGTSWIEEMDILNPILAEEPSDTARIVEVTPRTEACINAGFSQCLTPPGDACTASIFSQRCQQPLPPYLDKVYADSCSKSTTQSDRALAHIQALTLDAVGPLSEALEMINCEEEEEEEEVEVDLEKLGATLGATMTFIGNASTQMANLRRQRIMEDINKDLVPFTMEQETHFTAQAPMLFGPEFMKNATEHWDQVKALRRMREKPAPSGFQKAQFRPGRKKVATVRMSPYNKDARPGPKAQK